MAARITVAKAAIGATVVQLSGCGEEALCGGVEDWAGLENRVTWGPGSRPTIANLAGNDTSKGPSASPRSAHMAGLPSSGVLLKARLGRRATLRAVADEQVPVVLFRPQAW